MTPGNPLERAAPPDHGNRVGDAGRALTGNRISRRLLLASLAGWALSPAAAAPSPGTFVHWRGNDRNGLVAMASGWDRGAWPPKEPLWRAQVPEGSSSPLVWDGRVFVFGWRADQEVLVALDPATGQELWQTGYAAPRYGRHAVGDQNFYSGPSATPEIDPDTGFLYTLGSDGDLRCWDARRDGLQVWALNLHERFNPGRRPAATERGGSQRDYGYACAPLVLGEELLVEAGGGQGTLQALDKRTGEPRWSSQCQWEAGHSGGLVPMQVEGVPCVAAMTLRGLLVVRVEGEQRGQSILEHPWATDYANSLPTPVALGNEVLLTSAYNQRVMVRLRVTLQGASEVWRQPYCSGVCTPVVSGGFIYWANRGLHCLDLATGQLKWVGGRYGDPASILVMQDGRLLVWANEGDLTLVENAERSPGEYRELGALKGIHRAEAWPHVAAAGGLALCRDRSGNLAAVRL